MNAALLSMTEGAQRLNMSVAQFKKYVYSQQILSIKLGDRRLIPADEIDKFIARVIAEQHPGREVNV